MLSSSPASRFAVRPAMVRLPVALILLLAYVVGSVAGGGLPPAWSDTAPPESGTLATVSSDALPTVQIDGVVWSQVVAGNTVYVGGDFQTARPAGAAAGTQTVSRPYLLAYNLTTGELISSFQPPAPDAQVRTLAVSPDGSTLYVGGNFTKLGTTPRSKLAAFDIASGTLKAAFNPTNINGMINALAVTASTVYLAGQFTGISGVAHRSIGAVNGATGAVTSFNPIVTNGYGESIIVSPDQSKVVIGGRFNTVNGSGNPGYGMAIVDAPTGQVNQPFATNEVVRNATNKASITSLYASTDGFYGTGFDFTGGIEGNFEGTFKSGWDGKLIWLEDCHGDTYATAQPGGAGTPVYSTGHPHYCSNIGGFPETPSRSYHRALAFTSDPAPGKIIAPDPLNYPSFVGKPRPDLLTWFPDINSGTFTGQTQGAWTVGGNADYVLFGGEFTAVNTVAQQGIVRFAKSSIAPNLDRPRMSVTNFVPTVQAFPQGVRVSWPANFDRDNELIRYNVIRNGDTATPIYTTTIRSTFWQRPMISFLDETAVPGTSYTYSLRAIDPFGNVAGGSDATITAGGGPALSAYDVKVLNTDPLYYWRLAETSGTAYADIAGSAASGTRRAGVTPGAPGAINGDPGTAFRFNGSSTAYATNNVAAPGLQTFSIETWFKTSSATGGRIMGFSSSSNATSTTTDRHLYLTNNGRLYYGALLVSRSGTVRQTISSPAGSAYNNNQWHHAVATQSVSGFTLFVDGALVDSRTDAYTAQPYSGGWRLGSDQLTNWPDKPTSNGLNGDIDDAAVYNVPLSASQVLAHYNAGKASNAAPTAAFTATCTELNCAFDASASTDADGTIDSYAWTFGDGTTGTGLTPAHAYETAGNYSVKLTITDNDGSTDSLTKSVTATQPVNPAFVSDTFDRTVAAGFGTADIGGAWTATSTANEVSGGAGLFKMARAGSGPTAYLDATKRSSTDLRMNLTVDKPATGGGLYLTAYGRRISSTLDYRTTVLLTNANKAILILGSNQDGTSVNLAPAVTLPGTVLAGDVIHLRMQTFGVGTTTVRTKMWLNSQSEPSAWTVSADSTFGNLQAPGAVGLGTYLSGSATNAPVVVSLRDLTAEPVV